MKNIKLLFILFIGLGIVGTSCKKTEEEQTEDLINQILDIEGSINLDVNGTTFDRLFSSVIYSESDKMVSFWAYNDDSEDSFILSFGEVPTVGATGTIDNESDNGMQLLILGSFMEGDNFMATSGTIKRTSTDKYEIDVVIADIMDASIQYVISGRVTVGKNNP